MEYTEFRRLFAPPVVRALLNWDLLQLQPPDVSLEVVTDAAQVKEWFTPWYLDEGRTTKVDYDQTRLPPLRLGEVEPNLAALEPGRRELLQSWMPESSDDFEVPVLVPAYALPARGRLVLDRNHRLAAGLIHSSIPRLLVATLEGRCEPIFLPDLAHWT